ncbi:MAG: SDR family oxidoreductase [Pirellulaceae bacterium]
MRRKIEGKRILLTGASSGIGRALAATLAKQGAQLLITARRADRLANLAAELKTSGGSVELLAGDITSAKHRQNLAEWADQHWGGLDILINNAGVGALGPFAEKGEARLRQVMEVNFFGPVELTRICLPLLEQGRQAAIVNIGSILGHRAVPGKSEYCASKFALHGFSDSLRAELADQRIDVILVSPSTTQSEFFSAAIETEGTAPAVGKFPATPESIAQATVRAIQKGRHETIPSISGAALVWLDRICPPLANRVVARWG